MSAISFYKLLNLLNFNVVSLELSYAYWLDTVQHQPVFSSFLFSSLCYLFCFSWLSDRWLVSKFIAHTHNIYRFSRLKNICGKELTLVSPFHIRFVSCIHGCASINLIIGKKMMHNNNLKRVPLTASSKQTNKQRYLIYLFKKKKTFHSSILRTIGSSAVRIHNNIHFISRKSIWMIVRNELGMKDT